MSDLTPKMSAAFLDAFSRTIGHEGRYSNNPKDNGGETCWGITIAVARENGYFAPMRDMPIDVARDIYHRRYWLPLRADELPPPLAPFLFDFAVNSGVGAAAKALQRAVGALPDGAIGPKTLDAVRRRDAAEVVRLMFVDRAKIFARHEDLNEFGSGWFARLFDVTRRFFNDTAKA